jgi:hypothetical protein
MVRWPGRGVAGAAGEEVEVPPEPGQQRRRRQDPDPRRRQLDRQRQAVEAGADRGDRREVPVARLEPRVGGLGAGDEEPDGLVACQLRRCLRSPDQPGFGGRG